MRADLRIVAVSDVPLGYGSPQIPAFVGSLKKLTGSTTCVVLEPDRIGQPVQHGQFSGMTVRRIFTTMNVYTPPGRIEYLLSAVAEIDRLKPDILVLFCTFTLPLLYRLRQKPGIVIYYNYESVANYPPADRLANKWIEGMVDLLIYPEENRAARDMEYCGFRDIPLGVVYNCPETGGGGTGSVRAQRVRRILYAGTIDRQRTFPDYFADPRIAKFPIDIFGRISGAEKDDLERKLKTLVGNVRFRGFLDGQAIARIRSSYLYSIIMWNPVDDQHFFACPNKFFEAIADGVPPIAAPHPQCRMIIDRYGCGILMDDWSLDSFARALGKALTIAGTPAYDELVENCRNAVASELTWDHQFAKLLPHLERLLAAV
ncbi:MAG TPA: glycosyltransferase [Bacteroidota bacterium]|nr:glycosyltransferase [Bacteroidota bacterium]